MKSTNRRRFLGLVGTSLFAGCSSNGSTQTTQPTLHNATTSESTETTTDQTQTTEERPKRDDTHSPGGPTEVKIDLHTHLRWGGDQEMADRYAELGFDALVGTDHHNEVEPSVPGNEEAEQVEDYSDLDFPGPILNGIELSENRHVNVIKSDNEMIKQINHPMKYDMDAEEIRTFANRIGADLIEVDAQEALDYHAATNTYRARIGRYTECVALEIVAAVATVPNTPPGELPPIYDDIDPDAFDALAELTKPDTAMRDIFIVMTYVGYEVTVDGDGVISIRPLSAE